MIEINKIYNEDCLETMKRMPDNYIDLVVTSPPYDTLRDYNGYEFDYKKTITSLYRIIKVGGVVVWVISDSTINGSESGSSFTQALFFKEIGFNIHDTMIWYKDFGSAGNRYYQYFEYMFVFSKSNVKTFNPIKDIKNNGMNKKRNRADLKRHKRDKEGNVVYSDKASQIADYRMRDNIWFYSVGFNKTSKDKIAFEHPAIFPEELASDHILSWSNENDLIYDPFIGSGTTGKMAFLTNRNFIGSEISEEYCKIANERINSVRNRIF
jgi:site-specific DNA-methyltransferase (adenine-specific)